MSFVVTLVNDYKSDHLKAVADDGVHGLANCQFPKVWNGISREDFNNKGKQFEVRGLEWTGKFYRVRRADVIREIVPNNKTTKPQIDDQAEKQTKATNNSGFTPIFDTNNEASVVDLSFFDEALTGKQINESLRKKELFDDEISYYFN